MSLIRTIGFLFCMQQNHSHFHMCKQEISARDTTLCRKQKKRNDTKGRGENTIRYLLSGSLGTCGRGSAPSPTPSSAVPPRERRQGSGAPRRARWPPARFRRSAKSTRQYCPPNSRSVGAINIYLKMGGEKDRDREKRTDS
jgi:hypothetical protein